MAHSGNPGPAALRRTREQERDDLRRIADPEAETRASFAPPLTVGHAFDDAEQAADRAADEAMRRLRTAGSAPPEAAVAPIAAHADIHRSSGGGGGAAPVVGAAGGVLPDRVAARIDRARGGGAPLATEVRREMESAMGRGFGDVRIHQDGEAATLNSLVSARAFTVGKDIFFGRGEYQPGSDAGRHVLAHELAHVAQGSSSPSVHRLWDFKSKSKLPIGTASNVRTLRSRAVWFVRDRTGDEMVVKPDDQPTGLGDLVAHMHKTMSGTRSVRQRKLDRSEIHSLDNMIEVYGYPGQERSWHERGQFLLANPGDMKQAVVDKDDRYEPSNLAKDDALARLKDRNNNMVAMTVAEGEDAMAAAVPSADGRRSRMRELLEDSRHCHQLGQVHMIDLFMGNQDRLASGNLGNWFYSPTNAITLIDHIDPGANASGDMTAGMADNITWRDVTFRVHLSTQNQRSEAASEAARSMMWAMARQQGDGGAGDQTAQAWFAETIGQQTRRQRIAADILAGMDLMRARIVKVFAAKKFSIRDRSTWKLSNLKDARKKKKIGKAANAASAQDTGDARYDDGQQLDYFSILQERATMLAGAR